MKLLVVLFIIASCSACATNTSPKTTSITAQELQQAKITQQNTTLSNWDFAMANLQGVPVPKIGTERRNIEKALARANIKIKEATGDSLMVMGKKRNRSSGVTIDSVH